MANKGVMVWLWSDLKVSNFVRWTWMEQAQLCTTWKRFCRGESWRLWGAKPAGYSLFDIYVSGVVSASCLGIWRNFHCEGIFSWEKLIFLLQTKRARILSDAHHSGHFATCSPFITWCAILQTLKWQRDRWFLISGIPGANQVQTVVLECLPEECSEAQKVVHWFQWLLIIGVFKKHMFQASTAFLAAGQLLFEDNVYLFSFCTSTDTSRISQIHGTRIDLVTVICRPLGYRYKVYQSLVQNDEFHVFSEIASETCAEVVRSPRPKALRCGLRRCPSCPPATPRGPETSDKKREAKGSVSLNVLFAFVWPKFAPPRWEVNFPLAEALVLFLSLRIFVVSLQIVIVHHDIWMLLPTSQTLFRKKNI